MTLSKSFKCVGRHEKRYQNAGYSVDMKEEEYIVYQQKSSIKNAEVNNCRHNCENSKNVSGCQWLGIGEEGANDEEHTGFLQQ